MEKNTYLDGEKHLPGKNTYLNGEKNTYPIWKKYLPEWRKKHLPNMEKNTYLNNREKTPTQ